MLTENNFDTLSLKKKKSEYNEAVLKYFWEKKCLEFSREINISRKYPRLEIYDIKTSFMIYNCHVNNAFCSTVTKYFCNTFFNYNYLFSM